MVTARHQKTIIVHGSEHNVAAFMNAVEFLNLCRCCSRKGRLIIDFDGDMRDADFQISDEDGKRIVEPVFTVAEVELPGFGPEPVGYTDGDHQFTIMIGE